MRDDGSLSGWIKPTVVAVHVVVAGIALAKRRGNAPVSPPPPQLTPERIERSRKALDGLAQVGLMVGGASAGRMLYLYAMVKPSRGYLEYALLALAATVLPAAVVWLLKAGAVEGRGGAARMIQLVGICQLLAQGGLFALSVAGEGFKVFYLAAHALPALLGLGAATMAADCLAARRDAGPATGRV